ncbi:hypothetical protein [Flammeovirga pacifica]|uniref:Uncharacterized protein n=1 Tax=Flammeovirga pacifica TaxID=915059 RepID=A0A1S1YXT5_FLAPC|nr:hypothetical protein [Flammeovirga pacifica]OHX65800.1 hypothetical protein NH26_05265 [Flammeovirga pacifica]
MRYTLFLLLFFTFEVLQAQTYSSLSQLKHQQAILQQKQLEDSLLQMGEVPQLVSFVGGIVGVSKAHDFKRGKMMGVTINTLHK